MGTIFIEPEEDADEDNWPRSAPVLHSVKVAKKNLLGGSETLISGLLFDKVLSILEFLGISFEVRKRFWMSPTAPEGKRFHASVRSDVQSIIQVLRF